MFFKGDEFLCQAYKKLNKILEKLFKSTDDLQGQITSNKSDIEDKLETHKKSKDHPAKNITYEGKINKGNVRDALDDTKERIDNIVGQGGNDNTEVVDARHSTIKGKTFNVLKNRLEEIESDMSEPAYVGTSEYGPVIHLPNNALNGQLGINIKGDTLTNLAGLSGKGFNSPIDEITRNQGTIQDGVLELTSDGKYFQNFILECNFKEDTTYTLFVNVLENTLTTKFTLLQVRGGGSWTLIPPRETGLFKVVFTPKNDVIGYPLPSKVHFFINNSEEEGKNIKLKNLMILEGDYTDREINYIEGTKSVPASFKVKSIGKNLFDINTVQKGSFYVNGHETEDGHWFYGFRSDFIRVNPNSDYILSGLENSFSSWIFQYDNNKNFIQRTAHGKKNSVLSVKTINNTSYIRFAIDNIEDENERNNIMSSIKLQFEKGDTATEYEPYKEDISYVIAKKDNKIVNLNRLPNVYDEIDLDEGKMIKRTKDVLLDGNESIRDGADIGDVYRFSVPSFNNVKLIDDYSGNNTCNLFVNNDNFKHHVYYSGNDEHFYFHKTVLFIFIEKNKIDSQQGNSIIDKFKNWIRENKIIVIYELAEPYEMPIRWDSLNGYRNGTVYIETIFPEVGFYYDNGLYSHYPDYPIRSVENLYRVDKDTGLRYPLDASKCILREDRLSFTHSDLKNGDLCDWDYSPLESHPNPETTIVAPTNLKATVNSLLVQKERVRQVESKIEGHERDIGVHFTLTEKEKLVKVKQEIDNHKEDVSNPHEVTKLDVGLNNVKNVEQITKSDLQGIITMWSGTLVDLPASWVLCDGTNGTPDLRDKFILGANSIDIGDTGGSHTKTISSSNLPAHSHSFTTNSKGAHTHTGRYKTFSMTENVNGWQVLRRVSSNDDYDGTGNIVHSSGGAHSHSGTTNSTGDGSTIDIRPSYYKLAFIMFKG